MCGNVDDVDMARPLRPLSAGMKASVHARHYKFLHALL